MIRTSICTSLKNSQFDSAVPLVFRVLVANVSRDYIPVRHLNWYMVFPDRLHPSRLRYTRLRLVLSWSRHLWPGLLRVLISQYVVLHYYSTLSQVFPSQPMFWGDRPQIRILATETNFLDTIITSTSKDLVLPRQIYSLSNFLALVPTDGFPSHVQATPTAASEQTTKLAFR